MEDISQEKYVSEYHLPISIEQTEKIIYQMKHNVCKIYKGGFKGTGFFCRIAFSNTKQFYGLITNNHVLNENDIKLNSCITFSIGDEKIHKTIQILPGRKKYTNEELDITFIEIKLKEDRLSKEYFFEIDENIDQEKNSIKNIYEKKSIYLIGYPDGKQTKVSYGIIKEVNNERINHLCNTANGSSGSPIILLENYKVIGVHFGSPKNNFAFNLGTFMKYFIMDFNKNIKEEKDNTDNSKSDYLNNKNISLSNSIKSNIYYDYDFEKTNISNKLEIKEYSLENYKYFDYISELFRFYKKNKNNNCEIEIYENNYFVWKISFKKKSNLMPILIDFSHPPKYNLSEIIYFDNKKKIPFLSDYEVTINLENEDINDVSNKLDNFLNFLSFTFNIDNKGTNCLNQ